MNAMVTASQQKAAFYQEILKLYDLADDVVNAIGHEGVQNRSEQLELVVPFLTIANRSIDTLAAVYGGAIRENRVPTPEEQAALEGAYRNFFLSLRTVVQGAETW
jgi:hypothetical protein